MDNYDIFTETTADIRARQVNNLARRVLKLERDNHTLRLALRELAAHVSEEAWRVINESLENMGTTNE